MRQLSLYDQQAEVSEEALSIAEANLPENHYLISEIYHSMALTYWNLRLPGKSEQYNLRSIKIKEILFGKDHPLLASNYNTLTANYMIQNRNNEAVESGWESHRIALLHFGTNHLQALRAKGNVAAALTSLGKLREALELKEEVLATTKKIYPPDHEEIAKAHHAIGMSYKYLGQHALGREQFFKAAKIRESYWTHHKWLD